MQIKQQPKVEQAVIVAGVALMSVEGIKAAQDGIKASLKSLDMQVHNNAVQCLLHASVHGDTSLMRRLLVDVIDTKTGYRRAGLINWMRKFSPMELKGDTINLSGIMTEAGKLGLVKQFPEAAAELDKIVVGEKRPFLIELANDTPFWSDADNAERVAQPVFQDTMVSPITNAVKRVKDAIQNTVDGKAVDPSKPFFDGVHSDKILQFAEEVEKLTNALPKDSTRDVRRAQEDLRKAQAAANAA